MKFGEVPANQEVGDPNAGFGGQGASLPAGLGPLPYAGSAAPAGWLLCDGQAVSRTTYAALFAVIGTVYGAGDGSTTFNVPDCRGRVVAGRDAGQAEFDALGKTGGAKTHVLTEAEMPSHTHGQNPHNHLTQRYPTATGGSTGFTIDTSMSGTLADNTLPVKDATAVNQNTGGGGAHNNLQPYIVTNKIIKT